MTRRRPQVYVCIGCGRDTSTPSLCPQCNTSKHDRDEDSERDELEKTIDVREYLDEIANWWM